MTVSDELVERVALAMRKHGTFGHWGPDMPSFARAAIAALSTPDFVLPLAEEMMRASKTENITIYTNCVRAETAEFGELSFLNSRKTQSLLDAYRAAKGE